MYRRRKELDRGRGDKLRSRQARNIASHLVRQTSIHPRRQKRRQIERSENSQAIAHSKKNIARQRNRSRYRTRRPEEFYKDLVLVHAQPDIRGGRGGELAGAGGDGGSGAVGDCGGCGVEGVGGHVGAAVEGEDEGAGAGEEESLGPGEEGCEGGADGGGEGVAAGGIFHDGACFDMC